MTFARSWLLVSCAVALLAGCMPHYRVATGTPAARARLVVTTDENTTFNVLDASRCPTAPKPQLLAATGKTMAAMGRDQDLGMAGISPEPAARTRERWLAAGARVHIAVASIEPAGDTRCAAGVSFVPIPGRQYEIRYLRNEAAGTCGAQVLRIQPSRPESPLPEPTQLGFRALHPEFLCQAQGGE
jgi:hypothetical protein